MFIETHDGQRLAGRACSHISCRGPVARGISLAVVPISAKSNPASSFWNILFSGGAWMLTGGLLMGSFSRTTWRRVVWRSVFTLTHMVEQICDTQNGPTTDNIRECFIRYDSEKAVRNDRVD
jgi:hypothetical protein